MNLSSILVEWWQPAVLFLSPWIAYWDIIPGAPVSDDVLGIFVYDGKMQQPLSWHNIFKKLRWLYGRIPNPNFGKPVPQGQPVHPQWIQCNRKHHRLNIMLFGGVLVLLYSFLSQVMDPQVAFLASLLFACHPMGTQVCGWISGIGYLMGTLFMLVGLNFIYIATAHNWLATPMGTLLCLMVYGFIQLNAVEAIFVTSGICVVVALLGFWPFAIVGALLAAYGCFSTFREAVTLRKKTFKEQAMERSTSFHARKLIVMLKTLWYDTKISFFPKRMGLYAKYGYHYKLPEIEQEDKYFWWGVLVLAGWIALFIFGPMPIKLAVLWFGASIIVFLNAITANQFTSERYVWLPSVGTCIIVAWYTQNLPYLYWFILGVALMRLWAHIPTYFDEEWFYRSNIWNFPDSEVAYGNLGVILQMQGRKGAAIDTWTKGIQINKEYDVNWFNLYSINRAGVACWINDRWMHMQMPGPDFLQQIRNYLVQAISVPTCHFKELWGKELSALDAEIEQRKRGVQPVTPTAIPRPIVVNVGVTQEATSAGTVEVAPTPQAPTSQQVPTAVPKPVIVQVGS